MIYQSVSFLIKLRMVGNGEYEQSLFGTACWMKDKPLPFAIELEKEVFPIPTQPLGLLLPLGLSNCHLHPRYFILRYSQVVMQRAFYPNGKHREKRHYISKHHESAYILLVSVLHIISNEWLTECLIRSSRLQDQAFDLLLKFCHEMLVVGTLLTSSQSTFVSGGGI